MTRHELEPLLSAFDGLRVLVVGDLMLDEYIWGHAERISPEAPVPVVRWQRRTYAPGGAANVVNNAVALGARAVACGIVGDDRMGAILAKEMESRGIDTAGVIVDAQRPTTRKTRVFARGQQMLRLDHEITSALSVEAAARLVATASQLVAQADAVILSDYSKGILSAEVVPPLIETCRQRDRLVTAGPKPDNLSIFAGAALVSLNRTEASSASGLPVTDEDTADRAGQLLLERHHLRAVAITRGGEGVSLLQPGQPPCHIPAKPVQVFDECGCGDTFLCATTLALAAGADAPSAVRLGNMAGAAVVQKVGAVTVDRQEILSLADQ